MTKLLRPAFQPVCRLQAGNGEPDVRYYESLMRIEGDTSGSIHTRLIPVAERCGFIGALDIEMLRAVFAVLNEASGISIGVNFSTDTLEFLTDWLISEIESQPHEVVRRLVVEITETHQPENYEAVASAARRLRAVGCTMAMDDFGDGFADEKLVDCIEPRLIKLAANALDDETLLHRAVLLGHDHQAELVAEQVRNAADVNHLMNMGVTYGQGYYFGRPQHVINYRRTPRDWMLMLVKGTTENAA